MSEYFSLSLASGTPAYPNEPGDHDIFFVNGVLQTCMNGESVAQRVRQRLEYYEGEWFLNTDNGTPWFQFVYVEPFHQPTAEAVIKAEILATPGVREITEFDVTVDFIGRGFNLNRVGILTDFNDEVTL